MRLVDEQRWNPACSNVIKLIPEESVVKLRIGDPIRLTAEDFERLSAAFSVEIERKFL